MKRSGSKYCGTRTKAQKISENIFTHCLREDDQSRFLKTGDLVPTGSLHISQVSKCMRWAAGDEFGGRFFTKAACEEAVNILITQYGIRVPLQATQTLHGWSVEQASRIQYIAARARRNTSARWWYYHHWHSPMDHEETQPMAPSQIYKRVFFMFLLPMFDASGAGRLAGPSCSQGAEL